MSTRIFKDMVSWRIYFFSPLEHSGPLYNQAKVGRNSIYAVTFTYLKMVSPQDFQDCSIRVNHYRSGVGKFYFRMCSQLIQFELRENMPVKTKSSSNNSTVSSNSTQLSNSCAESSTLLSTSTTTSPFDVGPPAPAASSTATSKKSSVPPPPSTPDAAESFFWNSVKDKYIYVKSFTRELKEWTTPQQQEKRLHLLKAEGVRADGKRFLLQVWGDKESDMFFNFFNGAAGMGNSLFALQDTDDVKDTDGQKLVLIEQPPNSYQVRFDVVYNLRTKAQRTGKASLIPQSFPKPVIWKNDVYFLPNGTPVQPPEHWDHEDVDMSAVNLTDLLTADEVGGNPSKKQKV